MSRKLTVIGIALTALPVWAEVDHSHAHRETGTTTSVDVGHDHMLETRYYGKVVLDKLEAGDDDNQRWDMQASYGDDHHTLWLKSEGEREDGATHDAEAQVLYGRAISPFFDALIGIRHDFQPQPARSWLAIGVQGLAPGFIDTEVMLFAGDESRSALRAKAEYDLRLTQRLILAPELEVNLHGEDDRERGIGSGLSDMEFGLRLRYEILREFAPYIGAVWTHQYGDTADFTRAAGSDSSDRQWVAGVHLWF